MTIIAFQGAFGANSDMACRAVFPDCQTLPCFSFEDSFAAVREGRADLAMIPIENSVAGRVADVHYLLPAGELHIIGEHYQPIEHHLLAIKGAKLEDIKRVESHVQALAQCRKWLRSKNITPVIHADTAGAAEDISKRGDKTVAAIASHLAGQIYGLESLATHIADGLQNTTRFLLLANQPSIPMRGKACMTTIIFRVRSVPAALYKSLGGFASNGVNITKLESYLVEGFFNAAQFYIDVEGHPQDKPMALALEELSFFADHIKILGTYPAHEFRHK
jgi:prephenate dehydratase